MRKCEICGGENTRPSSAFCSKRCDNKNQYLKNKNKMVKKASEWNKKNKKRRREILDKEKASGKPAYRAIIQRCTDKNYSQYKDYGGKGVECKLTFEEFRSIYFRTSQCEMCECELSDKNRNASNGRCIDRIDSDGHYEENNVQIICRSCNNKKDRTILGHDEQEQIRQAYVKGSKTHGTVALSQKYNVSQETIWRIVNGR